MIHIYLNCQILKKKVMPAKYMKTILVNDNWEQKANYQTIYEIEK